MKKANRQGPHEMGRPDISEQLAALRRRAPPGFTRRVMAALPRQRVPARSWWPEGWGWLVPAMSGAAAALLAVILLPFSEPVPPASERVVVRFELHAPAAEQVELVGDFNAWQPGQIMLSGPDHAGRWTAQLELPAGRHEYLFLVDGRQWVTDPLAQAHRPDGFGHLNAVVNL